MILFTLTRSIYSQTHIRRHLHFSLFWKKTWFPENNRSSLKGAVVLVLKHSFGTFIFLGCRLFLIGMYIKFSTVKKTKSLRGKMGQMCYCSSMGRKGLEVFFSACLRYGWWCATIKRAVYMCCILVHCFVLLCFRHWRIKKLVTYFKFGIG